MTKQVQRRRGTSTQHTSFTGAEGEISVNTTNKSIHVHDGLTAGGVEAARADLTNVSDANLNAALSGNTLSSLTITSVDINGGTIDGAVIGGSSAAAGTFTTVTASGDVTIADKIVHSGDTNTAIRFPAADTVTVETSGAERLRVTSAGLVGIGTASPGAILELNAGTNSDIRVNTSASGYLQLGQFSNGAFIATSSTDATAGILRLGTGGTERMRIDTSGNVGVGITNPAYKLVVSAAGASGIELGPAYSGTANLIQHYSRSGGVYVDAVNDAAQHRFNTSGTERMRITSAGNVGIGTSSPASKLDVRTGTTGNIAAFYGTSTYHLAIEEVGGVMFLDANNGSATIGFKTNDTERMRLDSSGTLGLGVTPSAWGSSVKVAQVSNASIAGQSNQALFSNNAFFDGAGWKYISSAVASQYYLDSNAQHRWLTAPSGTAGNAITFTQAMTLDASGHLYPDTTAQTLGTSAKRWGTVFATSLSDGADQLVGSSGTTARLGYGSGWTTLAFATGGTERARIDSSGNLLVGTTAASAKLTVNSNAGGSSYISGATTDFRTGGNTNNPNGRGLVAAFNAGGAGDAANTYGASITIGASSVGVVAIQHKPGAPFAIADFFPGGTYVGDGNPPTERLKITGAGLLHSGPTYSNTSGGAANVGIAADGAFYRSTSSLRYKNSVQDASHGLAELLTLRPVTYKGNNDGDKVFGGLIAEEVHEAGLTEFVQYAEDGSPDALAYSNMVSLCIKAIQELKAEVDSLRAQLNP